MSYPPVIAVVLTVIFAVTGAAGIYRVAFALDSIDRASNILHLVMSVAMVSMPWAWGLKVFPADAQIVVFSVATAFYLALLVLRPDAVAGPVAGHHSRPPLLAYHAAMMGSMIVMGVMMRGMGGIGNISGDSGGMKGSSGGSVPRMVHPMKHSPGMTMHLSTWESATSIVLGIGSALAAVWFVVDLVRMLRMTQRHHTCDVAVSALMAIGMSIAFNAM